MNLEQIKTAVDAGCTVYWSNPGYQVIKDSLGQYLIRCRLNGHCIGLHGAEGTEFEHRLNGEERDFYIQDYWAEREGHPLSDWRYEVANDDTRLGYHEWCDARDDWGEED